MKRGIWVLGRSFGRAPCFFGLHGSRYPMLFSRSSWLGTIKGSKEEEELVALQQERAAFHAKGDVIGEARTILELARACRKQGKTAPMVSHLRKLITMIDEGAVKEEDIEEEDRAWIYYELGHSGFVRGDFGNALRHLHAARLSSHVAKKKRLEARSLVYLGRLYVMRAETKMGIKLIDRGVALMRELADTAGERQALMALAQAQYEGGMSADAIKTFGCAALLARDVHDVRGEAQIYRNAASVLRGMGDLRSALHSYKKAIQLSDQAGDQLGLASSSLQAGNVVDEVSPASPEAVTYWKHAIQIARQVNAPAKALLPLQTEALYRLISHYEAQRLYAVGLPFRLQLVELMKSTGQKRGYATAMLETADVEARLGQAIRARDMYSFAREAHVDLKDEMGEVLALAGMSQCSYQLGDSVAARHQMERARLILESTQESPTQMQARARCFAQLAELAAKTGDAESAQTLARQAVDLAQAAGPDDDLLCMATIAQARAYLTGGDLEEARDVAGQGLAQAIRGKMYPAIQNGLEVLGDVALQEKKYGKAQEYFEKLVAMAEKAGTSWAKGPALQKLGDVAEASGDLKAAISFHMRAVNALPEGQERHAAFHSLSRLGSLHKQLGQDEIAESYTRLAALMAKHKV